MSRNVMTKGRFVVPTEGGDLIVEVVGKRPDHRPYIWIGTEKGGFHDSIGEAEMRSLAEAIKEALGDA